MLQVDYLPSRFDPCRPAEQYPIPSCVLNGRRTNVRQIFVILRLNDLRMSLTFTYIYTMLFFQCVIPKENNFKQAGERYRSWEPDRY